MLGTASVPEPAGRSGAMSNADLRRHNLSQVLKAVYTSGPLTRSRIAGITGLTRTAVSGLVAQLGRAGLVMDEPAEAGRVGRPSPLVRFAGGNFTAACVEISSSAVDTVLVDLDGAELLRRHDRPATMTVEAVLDFIDAQLRAAVAAAAAGSTTLLGIVIAVHGVVDFRSGTVPFFPGSDWTDLDLRQAVTSRLEHSVPVVIDHDANLAAIAEYQQGDHAREGANLISISTDTGVGAGIVVQGAVYRGSHGFAAEVGHMLLDPNGPQCVCGRQGCWSALIGMRTVLRAALPLVAEDLERVGGFEPAGVSALQVAARAGDRDTVDALHRAGVWLGTGAANLANLLDPDVIVVGGYLASLEEWVLPAAREAFGQRSLRRGDATQTLLMSRLGDSRVLKGGIHLVRTALLRNPVAAMASTAEAG
jgi:predicted NBD/HSP70 family sugar kinase